MTLSPIPPGREKRFARLYFEIYPYARQAVIALEVHTRKQSKKAVYSIKDGFDHIHLALLPDISDDDADKHFSAAEDHFRRAAIEPVEYIAEEKLFGLLRLLNLRSSWTGRILAFPPIPQPEVREKILNGRNALVKCRRLKSQIESVKEAHEAAVEAESLFTAAYDELGPKVVYRRFENLWCGVVAGLVVGGILGIVGFIIGRI